MATLIPREQYLQRLRHYEGNGLVKVITGIRRSGKSFLLFNLYYNDLLVRGIPKDHIIAVSLDEESRRSLRRPKALSSWIRRHLPGDGQPAFVLIDEIQKCQPNEEDLKEGPCCLYFHDILNTLVKKPNVEVYVTGSNSRMLSSDINTDFRGRSVEIRVWPLSFAEYMQVRSEDERRVWEDYLAYGGMPMAALIEDRDEKAEYLKSLCEQIYISDIVERYGLRDQGFVLGILLDSLFSNIGSLTNPHRLSSTLKSEQGLAVSEQTLGSYMDYFKDSFLLSEARRWDVKGNRHLAHPVKYYSVDMGLRNARLNMRQVEETHLMENIIYNELVSRRCSVDVGTVNVVTKNSNGLAEKRQYEIDFIVNRGSQKIYVQSALSVDDAEKRRQETFSLRKTGDFFRRLVIVSGSGRPMVDTDGIVYVGVRHFLLDKYFLDSLGY